jgi:lipopolysaccharide heptosyltransferase II
MINQIVPEPKPGPISHQAHHYLNMARYAGAAIAPAPAEKPVERLVANGRCVGLVPGAEYGAAKRWMTESFAAVARRVREEAGVEWRIFGVEGDRAVADLIATGLDGQCENLAGKTTLAELIERLRECRLVLSNDTGAMHLAAHLGVPVVAIFGSTEDRLTGPLGAGSRVVRHHAVCSPCFLRDCPLDFRCMQSVTVEEVTAAVLEELAEGAQAKTQRR